MMPHYTLVLHYINFLNYSNTMRSWRSGHEHQYEITVSATVPIQTAPRASVTPFLGPGFNLGLCVTFSCRVSLVSFDLQWSLRFALFFMPLTFFKSTGRLLYRIFLIWVCLMFSED